MTITTVGTLTIGETVPLMASATAAVDASVGVAMGELSAKLSGYILASVPSPTFDFNAQVTVAANAYLSASAELAAAPGGATLAATLDLAVAALVAVQADIRGAFPEIALKIDAALASKASLDVQLSSGIEAPSLNLGVITAQIAELGALKATLEAQLSVAASINAKLGVPGVRVYRFDGDIAAAGAEFQAQANFDGLHGEAHFVFLVPTTPESWGALQATIAT